MEARYQIELKVDAPTRKLAIAKFEKHLAELKESFYKELNTGGGRMVEGSKHMNDPWSHQSIHIGWVGPTIEERLLSLEEGSTGWDDWREQQVKNLKWDHKKKRRGKR